MATRKEVRRHTNATIKRWEGEIALLDAEMLSLSGKEVRADANQPLLHTEHVHRRFCAFCFKHDNMPNLYDFYRYSKRKLPRITKKTREELGECVEAECFTSTQSIVAPWSSHVCADHVRQDRRDIWFQHKREDGYKYFERYLQARIRWTTSGQARSAMWNLDGLGAIGWIAQRFLDHRNGRSVRLDERVGWRDAIDIRRDNLSEERRTVELKIREERTRLEILGLDTQSARGVGVNKQEQALFQMINGGSKLCRKASQVNG